MMVIFNVPYVLRFGPPGNETTFGQFPCFPFCYIILYDFLQCYRSLYYFR